MKYTHDPLSGVKIIYDKRIRVGDLRLDKSRKFFRMNPKTKPAIDKAIYTANSPEPVFRRMEVPTFAPISMQLNPPIILNVKAD